MPKHVIKADIHKRGGAKQEASSKRPLPKESNAIQLEANDTIDSDSSSIESIEHANTSYD